MLEVLPHPLSRQRRSAVTTRWVWETPAAVAVVGLSAVLELYHLNQLGYGNAFYAAAVLSMTQNLHAFLFNSFDPVGFVTIDKPPLGFWVQVLSAKLLGFSGFSILLPEALATVGSVALVYFLVRRAFGKVAGLVAGLMLALTPVTMTTGRNNTIDSLLVFTLLLATWTALRATERGSLRWLLGTAVLVGLGFEIKMMEAYLAVPALGLVYLVAAPRPRWTRVGHLALAAAVMLAVSFAWPVAVDRTPANERPWVDSTQNNSAVDLALGYDGFSRLFGQNRSVAQFIGSLTQSSAAAGAGGFRGGPGGGGAPGPLRLFGQQLGGQASWLAPLAMLGLLAGGIEAWRRRRRLDLSPKGQAAVVWGAWMLTTVAFFSVAARFQSYYLVTLAPPVVALAGIGVSEGWRGLRRRRWFGWLLPVALIATGLVEAHILDGGPAWAQILSPVVVVGAVLSAVVLLGWRLAEPAGLQTLGRTAQRRAPGTYGRPARWVAKSGLAIAVLLLVVGPGAWGAASGSTGGSRPGAQPLAAQGFGAFGGPGIASAGRGPTAAGASGAGTGVGGGRGRAAGGPVAVVAGSGTAAGSGFAGRGAGFASGGAGQPQAGLIQYLEQQQGDATYLAATASSTAAAPIIVASGEPVMSLGGFMGRDPIISVQQFADMVRSGAVRFYVAGGGGFGGGSSPIASWVQAKCAPVPAPTYGASTDTPTQLFDCGNASA